MEKNTEKTCVRHCFFVLAAIRAAVTGAMAVHPGAFAVSAELAANDDILLVALIPRMSGLAAIARATALLTVLRMKLGIIIMSRIPKQQGKATFWSLYPRRSWI